MAARKRRGTRPAAGGGRTVAAAVNLTAVFLFAALAGCPGPRETVPPAGKTGGARTAFVPPQEKFKATLVFRHFDSKTWKEERSGLYVDAVRMRVMRGAEHISDLFRLTADGKLPPPAADVATGFIGKLREMAWPEGNSIFEMRDFGREGNSLWISYSHNLRLAEAVPADQDVYLSGGFSRLPAGRYSLTIRCENDKRFSPLTCDFKIWPVEKVTLAAAPPRASWKQGEIVELTGDVWPSGEDVEFLLSSDDERCAELQFAPAVPPAGVKKGARARAKGAIEYVRYEFPKGYYSEENRGKYGISFPFAFPQAACYLNVREFEILPDPPVAWGEAVNGLQAGLAAPQSRFRADEKIRLVLHLKNAGDWPLKVYDNEHVPLETWQWTLTPAGGGPGFGTVFPSATLRDSLAIRPTIELDPGGATQRKFPFFFGFVPREGGGGPLDKLPAGRYTVAGRFSWDRAGDDLWRGVVSTGAVEIEVAAPEMPAAPKPDEAGKKEAAP